MNNLSIISQPTTKGKMEDYGAPDKFLEEVSYLLGKQAFNGKPMTGSFLDVVSLQHALFSSGKTRSEGGFAPDRVSAASILDVSTGSDKKGRTTYNYEIVTRTGELFLSSNPC